MKQEQYLGLTKTSAQNKAEYDNIIFRLIRVDSQDFLSYPEDSRQDRVCVEIDDGKVTKVIFQ